MSWKRVLPAAWLSAAIVMPLALSACRSGGAGENAAAGARSSRDEPIGASVMNPARILWSDGVENAYPRWSKDGQRILYQSNRTGKWQIYVMNRDGTGDRRVTDDAYNDNYVDWSPDNTRIAFVSDRTGNEDVFVMAMEGGTPVQLTRDPGRDIHPYWAPDGKSLLFNSNRGGADQFDVFRVNADGSGLRRLTAGGAIETCARLSPDGGRMVLLHGDTNDEVYAADADGGNAVNLTHSTAAEGWPAWSPDGTEIIYSSDSPGTMSLFIMKADGSGKRQITNPIPPFRDGRAMFSPDGSEVVFNRQNGRTIGIYTIPLRGSLPPLPTGGAGGGG
jgi:TolB protein